MKIKIRFYDKQIPLLKHGAYRVTTEMKTNIEDQSKPVDFREEMDLVLTNRRFALPEQMVYSVYPPADTEGEYGLCLPHIVLNDAALPWEYALEQAGEKQHTPGLALFVLSPEDGARERTLRIGDLMEPDPAVKVYVPDEMRLNDSDAEKEDGECRIVELPMKLFLGMCPDLEELALLAHVKEVSLDDKVTDPLVKAGRFSCIVANRFPRAPVSGEDKVCHKAYLISLREYGQWLCDAKSEDLARYDFARLICLAKWSFTVTAKPYDFGTIVQELSPDVLGKKPDNLVADAELKEVLRRCYHPLNHDFRDGSRSVSWYRPPLLPIVEQSAKPRYHVFSDELYGYSPEYGMFDATYACAWQLGRMLALENLSVCQETLKWRFQNCRDAAKQNQQEEAARRLLPKDSAMEAESFSRKLAKSLTNAIKDMPVEQEDH